MVKISVLDYAVVDEGKTPSMALKETAMLAQTAECLNFSRFWMAEHHDVSAFSSSSPELMMMYLLGQTSTIRLGSGGVMIPHYSPLKVAENFRTLESLYSNRVDLGIGNTLGTKLVNKTMNETRAKKQNYEENIADIIKYITNTNNPMHRFNEVTANPIGHTYPEMWVLSTSTRSARLAAKLGIGYTFGLFPYASDDKLEVGKQAAKVYKEEFKPSKIMSKPKVMIAPFIVIADTKEEANQLAKSLDVWLLGKQNFSEFSHFPSVKTASNYHFTETDLKNVASNRTRMIVGDKKSVKAQIDTLVQAFQADEVLLIPLIPRLENRQHALELISEVYNL